MSFKKQPENQASASSLSNLLSIYGGIDVRKSKHILSATGLLRPLANEDGFVLIAAIITLLLLVILGIFATTTTNIELQIAGNEKTYKQNFYKAEGAAMEETQILENAPANTLLARTVAGLTDQTTLGITGLTTDDQLTAILTTEFKTPGGVPATSALSGAGATTRYLAIDMGIDAGSSLSVTESKVHTYGVYGYSNENIGNTIISLGYKKRW
jgi:Tfp pilus assembly protein PilX